MSKAVRVGFPVPATGGRFYVVTIDSDGNEVWDGVRDSEEQALRAAQGIVNMHKHTNASYGNGNGRPAPNKQLLANIHRFNQQTNIAMRQRFGR